ncbi:MAG: ComEC/Rec2 family competence protein [Amaricoccus sp.]
MVADRLAAAIDAQRPQLALWIPVLYAAGIAGYFAAPGEPEGWMLGSLVGATALAVFLATRANMLVRTLLFAVALVLSGFGGAALRSRMVAAPVLPYEMTAKLEGRIIDLDRSATERPRVLLDQVTIDGLEAERTPARVRISLDPSTLTELLRPGMRLAAEARIAAPSAPSEPGGFDYRRLAWFERIGAVGYARKPVAEVENSVRGGWRLLAFRMRMAASAHIERLVPGQDGAFTSAILTGDRSGIDRSVETALRISSLYHIVSISGLHMTLLAAAVFAMIRHGLALVPRLALTWPLKKIAAWAALVAGGAYLVISGCDVATQRSYVMTATVLIAVLLDRPALTMRSIALAGMIVLMLAPESLVAPGFQMSFAATIALVAGFEALRKQAWWVHTQTSPGWRIVKPVVGIAMTSLIAGTATAPFSAFHFNTVARYGLVANLMAIPAMGIVVMPAAVIGVVLAPLGLDWLPFQAAGLGMGYVIGVAKLVSAIPGATFGVPAGPPASLGLIAAGGIFVVLWSGRGRWAGLVPMLAGAMLWAAAERPDLLIADSGRLFGIETEAGRVLSSGKGNGYAADAWLKNDGDLATQAEAYARGKLVRRRNRIETDVPGLGSVLYVGATDQGTAAADCAAATVLIAPNWATAPPGTCLFVGRDRLRRDGALAIDVGDSGLVVYGAKADRARPWTRGPVRAERRTPQLDEGAVKVSDDSGAAKR